MHRRPHEQSFDKSLWAKVHNTGNRLFDVTNAMLRQYNRTRQISDQTLAEARMLTSCGFCTGHIDAYRTNGQVQVRFGACGHYFHAAPEVLREGRSCYTKYIETKTPNADSCVHCRIESMHLPPPPPMHFQSHRKKSQEPPPPSRHDAVKKKRFRSTEQPPPSPQHFPSISNSLSDYEIPPPDSESEEGQSH